MTTVAPELLTAVTAPDNAWGWTVLRGVVDRVFQAHRLLHKLSEVFTAAPTDLAASAQTRSVIMFFMTLKPR